MRMTDSPVAHSDAGSLSDLQRYALVHVSRRTGEVVQSQHAHTTDSDLEPAADGELVRYDDVVERLRTSGGESVREKADDYRCEAVSVPDAAVFCAHCEHRIAKCPKCKKAEWRIEGAQWKTGGESEITPRVRELARFGAESLHWEVGDDVIVYGHGHDRVAPHECRHPDCVVVREGTKEETKNDVSRLPGKR
jgi:hypothetical protein